MTVLYLVRHAHSNWTADENRPLSSVGVEDARHVAQVLANFPITQIISSPYLRAKQTIEPLAKIMALEILEDSRYRERDLGDIGVSSFKEAIYRTWLDTEFAFPKGESINQAQSRAIEGLNEIIHPSTQSHVIISTHGNLLTIILNHFDPGVGYPFWQNLSMPDIYRLDTDLVGSSKFTRIWDRSS